MARTNITARRLRELLHYDPETGIFIRRVSVPNGRAGSAVTSRHRSGYLRVMVDGKRYLLHRLAWLYMTGVMPDEEIDHRDRNRANNKWSNLRDATGAQNSENRSLNKNTSSGIRGVFWNKDCQKWGAYINKDQVRTYLGVFDSKEAAAAARASVELRLFTHSEIATAHRDTSMLQLRSGTLPLETSR